MARLARASRLLLVVLVALAGRSATVDAAFIAYTDTVLGSGSLGGVAFTNAYVTFSEVTDTSNVAVGTSGVLFNRGTTMVTIVGLGTAQFTSATFGALVNPTFSNGTDLGVAGFGDEAVGTALATFSPAFATYSLTTAIRPGPGASFVRPGLAFATTRGDFLLNSTGGPSTFAASGGLTTANPAASAAPAAMVPEPSSLGLAGVAGLLGLGWRRLRRGRAA